MMMLNVCLVALVGRAQVRFERTYGGLGEDAGHSAQQTSDGGYIITGWTDSFGAGEQDVYLIKTDAAGDTLWARTYGGLDNEEGCSVRQTTDGGYVVAGWTYTYGAGEKDVYLIKTDATAETLWTRTYGDPTWEWAFCVEQASDGGYIVAGGSPVYLIRTDGGGDSLWAGTYGGNEAWSVKETSDGGCIAVGWVEWWGPGYWDTDIIAVKTDADGNTLWHRYYGDEQSGDWDYGRSVDLTSDGGYIIAGENHFGGAGGADVYLIKTDSLGEVVWSHTYGGPNYDKGFSVDATTDGGYVVAGWTESFGAGQRDVYLVKTDANGETLWTRAFGGPGKEWAYSVQETDDGGYIIAGWTDSFGAGGMDVYVIKTDANGLVQVGDDTVEGSRIRTLCLAQNHPNPFRSTTTIPYALAEQERITLAIYDIRGARVRTLISGAISAGQHQVVWDGRNDHGHEVGSGVYFCHVQSGERNETRRMVVLR